MLMRLFVPLLALVALMFPVAPVLIARAPYESTMGLVQKIFYFHVGAWAGMFLAAFPDLKVDIEIEIAEDDMVGGRLRQQGTHSGDMVSPAGTIAATGKPVNFTEVAMLQVQNGKVVKSWYWTDMIGLLTQVGAIGGPPAARG